MKTAVIGLPKSGTSLLWDILRHDTRTKVHVFEPLNNTTAETGTYLWNTSETVQAEWVKAYSPLLQHAPVNVGIEENECEALTRVLSAVMVDGVCMKSINLSARLKWFLEQYPEVKVVAITRDREEWVASMNPGETWANTAWTRWAKGYMAAGAASNSILADMFIPVFEWPSYVLDMIWNIETDNLVRADVVRISLTDLRADPEAAKSDIYTAWGVKPSQAAIRRTRNPSRFKAGPARQWLEAVQS